MSAYCRQKRYQLCRLLERLIACQVCVKRLDTVSCSTVSEGLDMGRTKEGDKMSLKRMAMQVPAELRGKKGTAHLRRAAKKAARRTARRATVSVVKDGLTWSATFEV